MNIQNYKRKLASQATLALYHDNEQLSRG